MVDQFSTVFLRHPVTLYVTLLQPMKLEMCQFADVSFVTDCYFRSTSLSKTGPSN
jgi:hypothetical protein